MYRCLRKLKNVGLRQIAQRRCLYTAGEKLHGYTVTSVDEVADFNLTSVELIHDKTGARHCHVIKDDSNNCFSVGFATTPRDDTGVAHILEHTALCGSHKYPVRDPFFKMLTRSFSTFMNAFTGPDFTMYPFSTQNEQDFYNLLSVYCDAALFPNLNKLDFLQEGWRLEHSDAQDITSDIVFKGVVFNEMKGYTNNTGYIFGQSVLNGLLPSHTYGSCSGGDPLAIPSLSHDQLVNFHSSHYHPSNATFYTYGDLPLEKHLEKIGEVVSKFEPISPNTLVPSEQSWSDPREITVRGPHDPSVSDNENNLTVAVSYKLPTLNDRYNNTALSVVTDVLTSGTQSKFYEALIISGLGSDFAPGTGLHSYTKDSYFTIGVKGVAKDQVEKVLQAIEEVWNEVVEEGCDEVQVAAILHQIEISKKHQTTSFGLNLGVGVLAAWLHGAKPADYIQLNTHLDRFKELESCGNHIKDLVKEHFVDNQHKLTVTLVPDEEYGKKLGEREEEMLREKTSQLSQTDKEELQKQASELKSAQDTVQDMSCLPCIQLGDVPLTSLHYPVHSTSIEGVPVQIYTGPTNGISYFRCLISDCDLADEQESVLPLYSSILSEVGAGGRTYQDCDLQKMLRTGKFSCSTHTAADKDQIDKYKLGTLLSSFCLNDNLPYMYSLWQELLSKPHFNETDRIKALLDADVAGQKDHITGSGHQFALTRSRSHISPLGELSEQMGGFKQAQTVQQFHSGDIQKLVSEVAGTHVSHQDRSLFSMALNTTPDKVDENLEALSQLLRGVPDIKSGKDYGIISRDIVSVDSVNEFIEISNLGVNFCARSYRAVPAAHPDSPTLTLLGSLLSSKFLHREIREKGGAYGSGAMMQQQAFSFFSYRDPNNLSTLSVFDQAITWATQGSFSDEQLQEAKISVIGKLDAPIAPGSRGLSEFSGGLNFDQRQAFRTGILNASRSDLQQVAGLYLSGDSPHGNVVVGAETETAKFRDLGYRIDTFGQNN
ncbi:presequence protease, mitochondrial-like [Bolinopsis microptera]|uniref:presequence protease, mitochondrial-like n=1 Tax=Bolinopsis microptera TaxID=2820187 RepID=UPI00307A0AD9